MNPSEITRDTPLWLLDAEGRRERQYHEWRTKRPDELPDTEATRARFNLRYHRPKPHTDSGNDLATIRRQENNR